MGSMRYGAESRKAGRTGVDSTADGVDAANSTSTTRSRASQTSGASHDRAASRDAPTNAADAAIRDNPDGTASPTRSTNPTSAARQLRHEHDAPARGLQARQRVYAIGSYHYNWHPALELLVVTTGEIELCVAGRIEHFGPGDVVAINSNDGHATLATQPHSTVLLLHIEAAYLASFTETGTVPFFGCRSTEQTRHEPAFTRLRALLSRMMLASERRGPAAAASWESGLLAVVATLFDHFLLPAEPGPAQTDGHRALERAVAYVDDHFRERLTLDQLARTVGFSAGYLSQIFPQQVGMTFSQYLTRVRLRHATRDLGERSRLIAAIALDNGFPDVKAFNTAFRRTFGRTPSAYRRLLTEDTRAADSVFHRRYVSRDDAEVMRVLRTWASQDAAGGAEEPCVTAALLVRPSAAQEALELVRILGARLEEIAEAEG